MSIKIRTWTSKPFKPFKPSKPTAIVTAVLLACFSVESQAVPSIELPPWGWSSGSIGFLASGDYFRTTDNFSTTRGSAANLNGSNSYQSFQGTFRARYGFHPLFSLYAGTGYAQSQVNDNLATKNSGQMTNGFIGADFKLPIRMLRIIPEIEAGFPFQQYDTNTTVPTTNEVAAYGRASLFLNKPVRIGGFLTEFYTQGGFYFPSQNLAKLFMYEAGAEFFFSRMLGVGGAIQGYETVATDPSLITDRQRISIRANGGSFIYNAYNPALTELKGWLRFNFNRDVFVRGIYRKSFSGLNTADEQTFSLLLSFQIPGGDSGSRFQQSRTIPRANQPYFQNGVEQSTPESFEADDMSEEAPAPTVAPGGSGAPNGNYRQVVPNPQTLDQESAPPPLQPPAAVAPSAGGGLQSVPVAPPSPVVVPPPNLQAAPVRRPVQRRRATPVYRPPSPPPEPAPDNSLADTERLLEQKHRK